MTTTAVPEVGSREVVRTPMLVFLEGTHEQWLQQVRGVLGPAGAEGAGMWVRWYAIEYLETGFKRRFERERRAVFSLHWRLTGAQASHLWAAGELIAQLVESLHHRLGLCHRHDEFSSIAITLMSSLEYWCAQVEEALGRLRWGELSPESRGLFEVITFDEASHRG